jgi:hypothetical protein
MTQFTAEVMSHENAARVGSLLRGALDARGVSCMRIVVKASHLISSPVGSKEERALWLALEDDLEAMGLKGVSVFSSEV